ncbi:MAG: MinD/ParA family protein [Pseudomonadota bacterium]|nr:MinD/ParA family protein [Pseudomonadota bacterium]
MASAFTQPFKSSTTKTISFTSGKGGVGKTVLLSNIAIHMARQGKKMLILDGDFAMANVDIVFGVRAKGTIHDVIFGKKSVEEIMMEVHPGIHLIPGGSGLYELQYMNKFQKRALVDQISRVNKKFDFMLVDTAPGIDDNVLDLNSAAQEICVVVTPDPSSLTDAYALIKVLNQRQKEERFSIICNQVSSENDGLALFQKLSDVTAKFLSVGLDYKGYIPYDPDLSRAVRNQQLLSVSNVFAPVNRLIMRLAENVCRAQEPNQAKGGIQFYWEQLLNLA